MKDIATQTGSTEAATLVALLEAQQTAHAAAPYPSAAQRIDRLRRLERALLGCKDDLLDAMNADFSRRGRFEAELVDITLVIGEIRQARRHMRRWMRPRRKLLPKHLWPARGRIIPQPKGVVGIIAPWNFPVYLALGPLAGALAAGNRAMIKPSELSPRTSAVLARMIAHTFAPEEVTVVTGGPALAEAFAALPLGHLIFTGSTRVGRLVAQAAAKNLTPVTLELGGKSPAIIGRDADLAHAAGRVAFGKALNAGQACIAPDYVLVPRDHLDRFVKLTEEAFAALYPSYHDNPDYTAMITPEAASRMAALVEDARAHGARIVPLGDTAGPSSGRALAPTLVIGPSAGAQCREQEIFGPLLPILPYDSLEDAQTLVAQGPTPLALYIFTRSTAERDSWLKRSLSGGVTVNDTAFHVVGLPFGGVGPSGTGAYHGRAGFETFSHMKSVLYQPKLNGSFLFVPPITDLQRRLARLLQRII